MLEGRRKRIRKSSWSLAFISAFLVILEQGDATKKKSPVPEQYVKCNKICGNVDEEKNAKEKILGKDGIIDNEESEVKTDRIVNGYDAPPRGFMALIIPYPDPYDLTNPGGRCGGSVINNRFVLTAGHCVCFNKDNTDVPCHDGKPDYDYKSVLKAIIGLSPSDDTADHNKVKKHMKDITNMILHPNWKGGKGVTVNGTFQIVDLALLKLKKRLNFDGPNVMPICLPFNPSDSRGKMAYVAGWGRTEKTQNNCYTDNRGPAKVKKCRFPFFHEKDSGEKYTECQMNKVSFPSNANGKCKQFRDTNPDFEWEKHSFIRIKYNNGKATTHCYSPVNLEKTGWCGVCKTGANEGEEGFCDGDMTRNDQENRDNDDEITVVKEGSNWGYCSKECAAILSGNEDQTSTLKETNLNIFTRAECARLQGVDKDDTNKLANSHNVEIEFCAGFKQKFSKFPIYNRSPGPIKNGNRKYLFTKIGEQVDKSFVKKKAHKKLDFFISFSDSCFGDSGGPLYRFEDKKAYQYGVVSRGGDDCGGFNQPGIYTSIDYKRHLDWIVTESSSGTC